MPKLPVAGLWIRLGALAIDLFMLLSAIRLISNAIPGVFWAAGEWSPYLTSGLCFFYFAAFNGPFGRGRTVGKIVFRIAATDEEGNPPTWRQSIIRTIVLYPMYVTVPLTQVILGDRGTPMEEYLRSLLTGYPSLAIVLATLISIPFNPFKQGLHDFAAGTLVRPTGGKSDNAYPSFDEMRERVGYDWIKFHRQPQYSCGVTVLIIMSLLAFMGFPRETDGDTKVYADARAQIETVDGYDAGFLYALPMKEAQLSQYSPLSDFLTSPVRMGIDNQMTSGALALHVAVSFDNSKRSNYAQEKAIAAAEEFAGTYRNVMLSTLAKLLKASSAGSDQTYSRELVESPVDLVIVYISRASLSPFPFPLQRYTAAKVFHFPPLGVAKSEEPPSSIPVAAPE